MPTTSWSIARCDGIMAHRYYRRLAEVRTRPNIPPGEGVCLIRRPRTAE